MDEITLEQLRQHLRVLLKEAERIKHVLDMHGGETRRNGTGTANVTYNQGRYEPVISVVESQPTK